MTRIARIAAAVSAIGMAIATPALAQTQADDQRFRQAQQRFDTELANFRAEYDRYTQARARGYRDPRGGPRPRYNDSQYNSNNSQYNDTRYDPRYDDRDEAGYDATQYYREGPQYRERVLTSNDRVYRGNDGRYYCKRNDGTTGLIIGAVGGGVLGNVIDGGHSRGVGTILGAIVGGAAGRSVDQNNSQVRCR